MTWGLTSAQVLQLNRGSDGAVFGIGRTGGSNNPSFKFSIADAGGLTISAGSGGLTMNSSGNVAISAPTSNAALTVNGFAGANVASILVLGSSVAGQSNGIIINAGLANINDRALDVLNAAATTRLFGVFGDGHFSLGYNGTTGTIMGTSSGSLTFTGSSTQAGYNFAGAQGAASATAGSSGALPAQVSAYWALQINGTNYKIPLYNN